MIKGYDEIHLNWRSTGFSGKTEYAIAEVSKLIMKLEVIFEQPS